MPAPLFDNRYFNDPVTSVKDVIDYAEKYPNDDIKPYIVARLDSLSEKIKNSQIGAYSDSPLGLVSRAKELFIKATPQDIRTSILAAKADIETLHHGIGDRMRWCVKDPEFIGAQDEKMRIRNIHSYTKHGINDEQIKKNQEAYDRTFGSLDKPISWISVVSYHEASVGILKEQQDTARAAAVSHVSTLQGNNVVALDSTSGNGAALTGTAGKQTDTSKVATRK